MNYRLVLYILGLILRVEAVLMLPSALVSLATGDGAAGGGGGGSGDARPLCGRCAFWAGAAAV